MGENSGMEQLTGRVSLLERDMGAVLERLDHNTKAMEGLMPKIDALLSSKTDIALLQKDGMGQSTRLDRLEARMNEHNDYVQRAIGIQWFVNAMFGVLGLGATIYSVFIKK